jgi:hypothetical protein
MKNWILSEPALVEFCVELISEMLAGFTNVITTRFGEHFASTIQVFDSVVCMIQKALRGKSLPEKSTFLPP